MATLGLVSPRGSSKSAGRHGPLIAQDLDGNRAIAESTFMFE